MSRLVRVMDCTEFRQAYEKYYGHKNVVYAFDVTQTSGYQAFQAHQHQCMGCAEWFMSREAETRGMDVSKHPCVHIAYHLTADCVVHESPWDCPSVPLVYVDKFDEYGIPIRDGSDLYIPLVFCPWCAKQLPASKREAWYTQLAGLGYNIDDPDLDRRIPIQYLSDAWFRQ